MFSSHPQPGQKSPENIRFSGIHYLPPSFLFPLKLDVGFHLRLLRYVIVLVEWLVTVCFLDLLVRSQDFLRRHKSALESDEDEVHKIIY